ncbi:acetylornithine transaminase [Actinobaculum sp. 313]|uniref:acetylornithine transaminase n=1 Tax=Actinobaculum sp. 313 TaxID=2495645 RepID=UPI000D529B4F|nr:acetylornithine transaminase [Actinobaculum sp. 313]AWE42461.1 acetylornithine transaminase [Actinobaculum sp. 313]
MTARPETTLSQRYGRVVMNTFGPPQLALVKGEGVTVWDDAGTPYLDLLGGIAVNALGYAHPRLVEAVATQMRTLGHVSNFFTTPPQVELAERLRGIFAAEGYDGASFRVFFANSGTEANEAALKVTRLHKPGGRVLALTHSFHGRTLGALSVTEKPAMRDPFVPLPDNVTFVEPTAQALEEAFDDDVAALFIEPIQGEAGVIPLSQQALIRARELCDAHSALLVMDEVQTGVGRTGRWLCSAEHVRADVVTLAKALAGGFPIGACVAVGNAAGLLGPGSHGSTFGGNPVASAASLVVLEEVEKLLPHVREVGTWLAAQLQECGYRVRGAGLLLGVEVNDSARARDSLLERGIIVNAPNPQTIRLAPPLVVTQEDLAPFVAAMSELAPELQAGL